MQTVQHNSYASNEGVSELLFKADSEIAKHFTCGKDKTSSMIIVPFLEIKYT